MSFYQEGQQVFGTQTNIGGTVNIGNVSGSMVGNIIAGGDINNNGVTVPTIGHIKFPKILSYANIVKEIQYFADQAERPYPHLTFNGTVKLHGTNSAIIRNTDGKFYFQSRNRMITPADDNAGFAQWCSFKDSQIWHNIFDEIEWSYGLLQGESPVRIFGEFVGRGIQSGMAINSLEPSFFMFGTYTDSMGWINETHFSHIEDEENDIYNVHHFKTWEIDIDFNNPQAAVETLEALSTEVGTQCPVGAELGHTGPGEGICFRAIDHNYEYVAFKIVHERFQEVSSSPRKEKRESTPFENHVRACITEARMSKVIDRMREEGEDLTPQNTRTAIQYIADDIWEEESLTLQEFGATQEDVQKNAGKAGGVYNQLIKNRVL